MPPRLHIPTTKATWRVRTEDLELLRAIHGEGAVNEVVRAVLTAYCDRLRARLAGSGRH